MNKTIDVAPEIIREIKNGNTLQDICRQNGISISEARRILFDNNVNYSELRGLRQQRRYEECFHKSLTLAASLKRLPSLQELNTIDGSSQHVNKIIEDLKRYGYHSSGKKDVALPLPRIKSESSPSDEFKIDKELLLDELMRIHTRLGRNISNRDVKQHSFYQPSAYKLIFSSVSNAIKTLNREKRKKSAELKQVKPLEDLKALALELGHTPVKTEIMQINYALYMRLYRRYGGLRNAVKAGGLETKANKKVSEWKQKEEFRSQLLLRLQEGIQKNGKVPEANDLEQVCGISETEVLKYFPSYSAAVKKAGFKPPVHFMFKQYDSNEMLLSKLRNISLQLGEQLKIGDYKKQTGYSSVCYIRRFGSVQQARALAGVDHLPFKQDEKSITKNEIENMISHLRQLFASTGQPLSREVIRQNGKNGFFYNDYIRIFGSIQNIADKTGISFLHSKYGRKKLYTPESTHSTVSQDDLIKYLEELNQKKVAMNKRNFALYEKPGFTTFDYNFAFGSFAKSLQSANIRRTNSTNKYSDDKLLSLLKQAIESNEGFYERGIFEKYNLPAYSTYFYRLGSVTKLLQKHNIPFKGRIESDDSMLQRLFYAYKLNGNKLTAKDLKKYGLCAQQTYISRFGGLENAIDLAIKQNGTHS